MEFTFTDSGKKAFENAEHILHELLRVAVYDRASHRGEPVEITQSDVEAAMNKFNFTSQKKGRMSDLIIVLYAIIGAISAAGGLIFPILNKLWTSGDYITKTSYLVAFLGFILLTVAGAFYLVKRISSRNRSQAS